MQSKQEVSIWEWAYSSSALHLSRPHSHPDVDLDQVQELEYDSVPDSFETLDLPVGLHSSYGMSGYSKVTVWDTKL